MGIWTLVGKLDGYKQAAVMVDSVSMTPFGPIFDDAESVEDFLRFSRESGRGDVRDMYDWELTKCHAKWLVHRERASILSSLTASVADRSGVAEALVDVVASKRIANDAR